MDQGANVDPANVIRAEDKPDLEAELPTVGTSKSLKNKFQSLLLDAYNAPTSIQADQAAKQLDVLTKKKSTNVKKMKSNKSWWWRWQARWQRC